MKYPIGLSIILNALAAISILSGCSDYLDREYDSFIDNEMTFTSYERTSKFLVNAYRYLPDGFNRIGSEAMLDAATDDAEHANASCNIQHFNTGAWNSRSNPDDLWNKYYAGIRIANEFIENVDRVNLDKYRLDPDNQNEYQNRLNDLKTWKYEARFLRAFFHFELVKRFGPVPVITSTLSVNADYSETPRPSMDDCISFISSECDKVAEVLDLTPGRGIDSDLGRATKGAALALKSRVLLYAASPLYLDWQNFSESDLPSDMEKWKAAAQAAKDVIDLDIYSLYGSYATLFKNNFQNSEFILMRRYGNNSDFEKYNFPVSYGGVGGINPSLNLVDSYEMKDGSYFSWENEENAVRPQFYRDDRLNATILLNDSVWKSTAVENWDGGKDGLGVTNATKTGFYLKKYLNEDVNIQTGGGSQGHIWPLFRLAEIYLNYAEALNEYDPENADIAEYVNRVRSRAGQPNLPSGLTQDEMRERIRRERRATGI